MSLPTESYLIDTQRQIGLDTARMALDQINEQCGQESESTIPPKNKTQIDET